MILKSFQNSRVDELFKRSLNLLKNSENKIITFQSPTGSGKTIMMAEYCLRLSDYLKHKHNICFIWIAPHELHRQSKKKLENYYKNSRILKCSFFEDLSKNEIRNNEILFLNWESINKKDNKIFADGDEKYNLKEVLKNTSKKNRKVILIIDESHHTSTSIISKNLINLFNSQLSIEVSATPKVSNRDDMVKVSNEEVMESCLIKKTIIINEKFKNILNGDKIISDLKKGSDNFVLDHALQKRTTIFKEYKKNKSEVNPLLLIQLPNERKGNEKNQITKIEKYLKDKHNITTQNGKLAIKLSGKLINDKNISKNNDEAEVLIFKQAIAIGWDCPRAQILVLFRDLKSFAFKTQTIGRIMRMPETNAGKKYYSNDLLNQAYIYTNVSDLNLEDELAKNFITTNVGSKIKNTHLKLKSSSRVRHREKDRLTPKFIEIFLAEANKYSLKKKININKQTVNRKLIADHKEKSVDNLDKRKITGSKKVIISNNEELQQAYDDFINISLSPLFPQERSIGYVKDSINNFFNKEFGIDFKFEGSKIQRIVLSKENIDNFINIIDITKEKFKLIAEKRDQEIKEINDWNIPEIIPFSKDAIYIKEKKSIIKPFYNEPWKTEIEFIKFLDKSKTVDWWFKNGSGDSKYFAIPCKKNNDIELFYIDFIVFFKNQTIGLFDTKSGSTIEKKHTAHKNDGLLEYIKNQKKIKLIGGIITNSDQNNYQKRWLVFNKKGKYLDSKDLNNWDTLNFN